MSDDVLEIESGVFGPSPSLEYHLAIKRILLVDPVRLLQMVVLPSFERELAVYVTGADRRAGGRAAPLERAVVVARVETQLWGAAAELSMSPPNKRGVRTMYPPADDTFRKLAPAVRCSRAPLRVETFERVHSAWQAALVSARPRERPSIGLDGVSYHFATPFLSGMTRNPSPGSVLADLVALGDALVTLATLPSEQERSSCEKDLASNAERLLMRIRSSAPAKLS